jgi:hypothetical protein
MNCWNSGEKKSRVVVHLFDSFSDKIRWEMWKSNYLMYQIL